MQTVSFTSYGVVVTSSNGAVNGLHTEQMYRRLFGRIMDAREGAYFNAFKVLPAQANDPDGFQDKRDRRVVSANLAGYSLDTARSSLKMFVVTTTNGVVTLTANVRYGIVQAGPSYDRLSESRVRHDLGLARNLSDRKSKRKRKPQAKKSTSWQRYYIET